MKKQKCLNLIPKMPDLGIFDQNFLIWGFVARILKKLLPYLKSASRIYLVAKFREKTKIPEFGTKSALFGYFWPKMPYLGIFGQEF